MRSRLVRLRYENLLLSQGAHRHMGIGMAVNMNTTHTDHTTRTHFLTEVTLRCAFSATAHPRREAPARPSPD